METPSKLNIFSLILLPVLAVVIGCIVVMIMYFVTGEAQVEAPAQGVEFQKAALAVCEGADFLSCLQTGNS